MDLHPVPRVPRGAFRPGLLLRDRPAIVPDCALHWPATKYWDSDYLRRAAGHRDVAVRETDGPPRNIFQHLGPGGRVQFGQYLEWVLETAEDLEDLVRPGLDPGAVTKAVCDSRFERSYYLDAKLAALSPVLIQDAPAPDWFRSELVDTNFWCGVLGTSSGLHCDVTPNCNVQVIGEKSFFLFPPSQARSLYKLPRVTHCRFDPNVPDYDAFPRARRAVGFHSTLRPGESLYIPAGWYHQVTVMSSWAVNVNFFWRRPLMQTAARAELWPLLLRRYRAGLRQRTHARTESRG
ncbi:cupin-like domain-containing protein [Streptomyces xanthophaeus]|uniref:cupin-like domain-containing protein n=1 Tax=Streptomyces xanthophaeus TaxID=67385 RepID=UPI00386D37B5|nr:cupin-like domain-containing protein [Streptomyces xanthophaeus]WST64978.1 cupin-like domain-containing protein [Streptomyces xanthophaeus]